MWYITDIEREYVIGLQRIIKLYRPQSSRYYLDLKRINGVVRLIKSTDKTPCTMKRKISKRFVIANEAGILGTYHHGHCVVELKPLNRVPVESCALVLTNLPDTITYATTTNPTTTISVNKVRQYMLSRNRFLTDCKAIRSLAASVKYITKEDMSALAKGIPIEYFRPDWQSWQIAKRFRHLDNATYQVRLWNTKFNLTKFNTLHSNYWNSHLIAEKLNQSKPYINKPLLDMLSPSKKGIIIYGSPGLGKTTTVLHYTKGKAFRMRDAKHCGQFCFSDFSNEDFIWMDDWRKEDIENHQSMLKQLTDDLGIYTGERKGGSQFYVHTRKVIITTNDDPAEFIHLIKGLNRRFDCLELSNLGVRRVLFK